MGCQNPSLFYTPYRLSAVPPTYTCSCDIDYLSPCVGVWGACLAALLPISRYKVQFPLSYSRREFPAHPGIYRSKTNLLILVLSVYKETVLRYNPHIIQNMPRTWSLCKFLFLNPEPQDPWRSASPTVPTPCLPLLGTLFLNVAIAHLLSPT